MWSYFLFQDLDEQGLLIKKDDDLEILHVKLKSCEEKKQSSHVTHDVAQSTNEVKDKDLQCVDKGIEMDQLQNLAMHEIEVKIWCTMYFYSFLNKH